MTLDDQEGVRSGRDNILKMIGSKEDYGMLCCIE